MNSNRMPKFFMILPLLFIIAGSVALIFVVRDKLESDKFMQTAVPVNASCTEIWETTSTDSDGDTTTSYHANIRYEYNGALYTAKDMSVSSADHIGSVITVYIDPANPQDARQPMGNGAFIAVVIALGVFIVVGIAIMVFFVKHMRKPKYKEPWEL